MAKTPENIQNIAKKTIRNEAQAIANLENFINSDFSDVVNCILNMKGRLIVSGIGKSANIGTKLVSTLNSTGTPAVFMHAADAIHGDLGMIQDGDVVLCISKSGNTPEIKVLVPLIKNFGNPLIALVGNTTSYLAQHADFTLNCTVECEACPNNLAPTASTTAQLVMGDALAVALLECRGFTAKDFGKYHPGGALGKQLYLRISDLSANNGKPHVSPETPLKDVILEMTGKRLGVTAVVENNKLVGVITDGDLRRLLQKNQPLEPILAKDFMGVSPKTILDSEMAVNAVEIMRKHGISQLLVVNDANEYHGVIHFHDLLREGIV
ncbi:MAG: KpsF/GutQ family sugar-phosphate isomerase [Bacteroidales bacterium]|jgi:arabinose-5-phosphate isomerase|nr:KpsF/GutQ family sugar-phosphate isomerase [Bacteroidales bacterium]